ncbi:hypothetical protein FGB62_39g111 [Gracilaria domingensis]|nr:hypothetical protein FGB62_39g111 [Gracilaria domingensis]
MEITTSVSEGLERNENLNGSTHGSSASEETRAGGLDRIENQVERNESRPEGGMVALTICNEGGTKWKVIPLKFLARCQLGETNHVGRSHWYWLCHHSGSHMPLEPKGVVVQLYHMASSTHQSWYPSLIDHQGEEPRKTSKGAIVGRKQWHLYGVAPSPVDDARYLEVS